jgi:hypothetical protein
MEDGYHYFMIILVQAKLALRGETVFPSCVRHDLDEIATNKPADASRHQFIIYRIA